MWDPRLVLAGLTGLVISLTIGIFILDWRISKLMEASPHE